jgi:hypothetical protein
MGWSSAWVAVEGADRDEVLRAVGCEDTGTVRQEWWGPGLVTARRGVWVIVFADGRENRPRLSTHIARTLSLLGTRSVYLSQSDGDMQAEIRAYSAGAEDWALVHHSGKDGTPWVTGAPPPILGAILEELRLRGGDPRVDELYEAAPELGRALVGFRHDRPESDDGFHLVRWRATP